MMVFLFRSHSLWIHRTRTDESVAWIFTKSDFVNGKSRGWMHNSDSIFYNTIPICLVRFLVYVCWCLWTLSLLLFYYRCSFKKKATLDLSTRGGIDETLAYRISNDKLIQLTSRRILREQLHPCQEVHIAGVARCTGLI